MYWIASWSPNQSLPLMVSYACHRQSSSDMLPRAALIPPWAATVCERVGNSLVMQAVRRGRGDIGEQDITRCEVARKAQKEENG